MKLFNTAHEPGLFRVWFRHQEWFYVSNRIGCALYVELPEDYSEISHGWLHVHLGWPNIGIGFPWGRTYPDHGQMSGPRFGFQFFEDLLWLYHGQDTGHSKDRGRSTTTIYMPWHWKHCSHEVRNAASEWEPYVPSYENPKKQDGRVVETCDYTYTLRSGEVQRCTASFYVDRRIWRRSWWWPRSKESQGINVEFDAEVGERAGSWKGGAVGCGWDLLPGETALDCLRRMERERKFN